MSSFRMLKRFHLKPVLVAVALIGLVGAFVSVTSAAPPSSYPKTFALKYLWASTDYGELALYGDEVALQLRKDKTFTVDGYPQDPAGTWQITRGGATITFNLVSDVQYTGERQPDGSYLGTMLSSNPQNSGLSGIWSGHYMP